MRKTKACLFCFDREATYFCTIDLSFSVKVEEGLKMNTGKA
jgi:hypothetical protein